MNIFAIAAVTAVTLTSSVAPQLSVSGVPSDGDMKINTDINTPTPEEIIEPVEVEMVSRWFIPGGTYNEKQVLDALQNRGIMDRAALATVLGNIKQESKFHSNICEGGARVGFRSCRSGGYGLIQWTTKDRYDGLGRHSKHIGKDPSTVDAQISYLFTERQWKSIEHSLRRGGNSIGYYMNKAYTWLGWGHHGLRTQYSHQYYNRLISKKVPAK